jgi:hypothetical protein
MHPEHRLALASAIALVVVAVTILVVELSGA